MPMKSRGFSTIELVIIMILVGILAVVAATQLGKYYGGIKQENATMKIASDIRYAQNRATTTQQRSQVNFAAGGINYTINSCASYTSSTCTCAAWSPVKTIDLSSDFSGVTIATIPGNCIEFDSLGRPYYNAGCANPAVACTSSAGSTVTVQYGGETDKTITIATQTGMVSY